jgi:5'-methylthioadenosine phosphorylase
MANAVILGSAFAEPVLAGQRLEPVPVHTTEGPVTLHRWAGTSDAWVLIRHGAPWRYLPHQIPWRAQALALAEVGVRQLLITSSVGVLVPEVPLYQPLLVHDLLWPDNRLPDGSACSIHREPTPDQGHLLLDEGLCSRALNAQVRAFASQSAWPIAAEVVFGYVGGPRSKTAAENRWWAAQGAQVNSMSVGPELVLANELEISTSVLAVGHKYSGAVGTQQAMDQHSIAESLVHAKAAKEALIVQFLREAQPVTWANRIYRYRDHV